jgi:hypothetical protein
MSATPLYDELAATLLADVDHTPTPRSQEPVARAAAPTAPPTPETSTRQATKKTPATGGARSGGVPEADADTNEVSSEETTLVVSRHGRRRRESGF